MGMEHLLTWPMAKRLQLFGDDIFSREDKVQTFFFQGPFARWWQLKYFVFSPQTLDKIPILTNIFQLD